MIFGVVVEKCKIYMYVCAILIKERRKKGRLGSIQKSSFETI
jgi:hypothetical protein